MTIAASTDFNPANPVDYATAMGNIANSMTQSTLASVGGILQGLPTVSTLSQGAYGFEGGVITQANNLFNNTSQMSSSNLSSFTGSVLPVVTSLAQQAAANQASAIQMQGQIAKAQLTAASNSGGKK